MSEVEEEQQVEEELEVEEELKRDTKGRATTGGEDEKSVKHAARLTALLIYEVIRRDGTAEMTRPVPDLLFSGLAAGILIAFSVVGEAIFRAYLPPASPSSFLLENLGYSLGFLLVILGRQQLFTENTITTVLPLMANPSWKYIWLTARLWGVVLGANVVGTFIAAVFIAYSGAFQADVLVAMAEISVHATGFPAAQGFAKAIPAGVLLAAVVWLLPTHPHSPFLIILTFTWLLAAGDFTHIVVGSVEMAYLVVLGELGFREAAFRFFLPVLAGNVIGGTAVFTLMAWGQVKAEVGEA